MIIYLRAGLYAEGSSDYRFLLPLLNRLIDAISSALFAGACEVGETIGVDHPPDHSSRPRAERIAAAGIANRDLYELLVIHSDGGVDKDAVRKTCVEPGMARLREAFPSSPPPAVACIPVREIEAWMLKDQKPFQVLLGSGATVDLPGEPEREGDPKARLQRILKDAGSRSGPEQTYSLFGEQVGLTALRTLPAFQSFEAELTAAIRAVAHSQGYRPGA